MKALITFPNMSSEITGSLIFDPRVGYLREVPIVTVGQNFTVCSVCKSGSVIILLIVKYVEGASTFRQDRVVISQHVVAQVQFLIFEPVHEHTFPNISAGQTVSTNDFDLKILNF
jgi:hypothetical protein